MRRLLLKERLTLVQGELVETLAKEVKVEEARDKAEEEDQVEVQEVVLQVDIKEVHPDHEQLKEVLPDQEVVLLVDQGVLLLVDQGVVL